MTDIQDNGSTLNESVKRLNETATTLASVLQQVDQNQILLVTLQHTAIDNKNAISRSSTKEELLNEVKRLVLQRNRDTRKTKTVVFASAVVSLSLIVVSFVMQQNFNTERHRASENFAKISQSVCEERSQTWDAMQEFIATQKTQVVADPSIPAADKTKMLTAYNKVLKSFPDVDCSKLGTGLAVQETPLNGISGYSQYNLAIR